MSQPGSSVIRNPRDLFKIAMKGDWDGVIRIYKGDHDAQRVKITRSGYTALHLAVSNGRENIVAQLVDAIMETPFHKRKEALEMQNEAGNTPLHIAASMGNVGICKLIVCEHPTLIGIQNNDGETPLFLAALHGKKDAFLHLHSCLPPETGISYCRRTDGDSILHCTIVGEYFDLAFQIIHLYRDLVNYVNSEGLTPLHVLASKPSAFKSGSKLGRFKRMVYKCLLVKKLERYDSNKEEENPTKNKSKRSHPRNYRTLVKFFLCVWYTLKHAITSKSSAKEESTIENPAIESQEKNFLPPNYGTCFEFIKVVYKAMLIVTGPGYEGLTKIQEEKEKHLWSLQILDELLKCANMYDCENPGATPDFNYSNYDSEQMAFETIEGTSESPGGNESPRDVGSTPPPALLSQTAKTETAILIAARHGITEIVEKILQNFPVAIHDTNDKKKNIALIAVENRKLEVFKFLLKTNHQNEGVFRKVDSEGNGALHFAANLTSQNPRWPIPGDALQMQWEIKWLKFVEKSMRPHFFVRYNRKGQTPDEIFTEKHKELVKGGGEWMKSTAESCSVVAALIATVAFATSTALPGGINESSGKPTLEKQPAFQVFAISSLIALCFSITSLVMFLAILTSRYQEKDFGKDLPWKLLLGLTSLFVSIASMLVSFCAGHFFVLQDTLKYAAFPVYALTSIPVSFFAAAQFPLYFDLIRATFRNPFGDAQKSYQHNEIDDKC